MPNHLHGIIMITDNGGGVWQYAPTPGQLDSPSFGLGAVILGFKSAVTRWINHHQGTPGQLVWQRNYFEHNIRDDDALNRVR